MVVISRYHCGVIVVMIQWLWSHGIIGFLVPQSFHTLPLSCALLPQLKSQHPMHCSFQNLWQNIDHFTWKPTTNTKSLRTSANTESFSKYLQRKRIDPYPEFPLSYAYSLFFHIPCVHRGNQHLTRWLSYSWSQWLLEWSVWMLMKLNDTHIDGLIFLLDFNQEMPRSHVTNTQKNN